MLTARVVLFFLVFSYGAGDKCYDVMKELKIIPFVLDNPPREFLTVIYSNHIVVNKGVKLTTTQMKDTPVIEYSADANNFYTVIMIAVEAPNRQSPFCREWLHWLVVNIPGTDIEVGDVLCPYNPPASSKSVGLSRFLFLVYKQTEKMVFDEEYLNILRIEGHSNFSTRKFAEKYGMSDPLSGNVLEARSD